MSDAETEALRHGAGAGRISRDVLAVRGPDADTYLQGQLSQDLDELAEGASADSLLLEPDGKLCALVRVTRTGAGAFVLDMDGGYGEAVAARLRRFLLRSKVEMEHLGWRCLAVRGTRSDAVVAALHPAGPGPGRLVVPFEWNGWRGVDVLGPADLVPDPRRGDLPEGAVACGPDAFEACRITSGVPAMGTELTGKTIAAEAGLVERAVSFTKGCYTGQELVARLDARGSKVARRLVGLVAPAGPASSEPLVPGMTLHAGDAPAGDAAAGDKVVGTVTSAAWSSELGAWAALAYLHRSVEVPGEVRLRTGDGIGGSRRVRRCPSAGRRRCGRLKAGSTLVTRFGELGWRTPALLALGIAYALVAAATTPFTWQADLITAIPIAALAAGAVARWPAHPTIVSEPGQRPRSWPWLVALVAVVTWELVSESFPGSRGDHPTLSSMLNAVDRSYGLKFVVFLGWLTLGWAVVQLGRPARR